MLILENFTETLRMALVAVFIGYAFFELISRNEPHWRTAEVEKNSREISPEELLRRL